MLFFRLLKKCRCPVSFLLMGIDINIQLFLLSLQTKSLDTQLLPSYSSQGYNRTYVELKFMKGEQGVSIVDLI